jgi:hypothetical protein
LRAELFPLRAGFYSLDAENRPLHAANHPPRVEK